MVISKAGFITFVLSYPSLYIFYRADKISPRTFDNDHLNPKRSYDAPGKSFLMLYF